MRAMSCRPRHVQPVRKWDECQKARENGHRCPDASPAKDKSGNPVVTGSSKQLGECPQCPPLLGQVSRLNATDVADMRYWSNLQRFTQPTTGTRDTTVRRKGIEIDRRQSRARKRCGSLMVATSRIVSFCCLAKELNVPSNFTSPKASSTVA